MALFLASLVGFFSWLGIAQTSSQDFGCLFGGACEQGAAFLEANYRASPGFSLDLIASLGGQESFDTLAFDSQGSLLGHLSPLSGPAFLNHTQRVATYRVQPGDTLSQIAASFNVRLQTILWANNLSSPDYLRPGQELTILPIDGVRHVVKPGETLSGIVLTYGGDLAETIAFNDLSEDGFIVDGQVIIVPGGKRPRYSAAYYRRTAPVQVKRLQGYFIRPTRGRLSQGLHAYNAVDIANSCGTPVYAAAPGQVIIADGIGWNGGYGKYIRIQHSKTLATVYAHLSRIYVSQGQSVERGATIGAIGSTGRSTGCHLHFEVRGAANPFAY